MAEQKRTVLAASNRLWAPLAVHSACQQPACFNLKKKTVFILCMRLIVNKRMRDESFVCAINCRIALCTVGKYSLVFFFHSTELCEFVNTKKIITEREHNKKVETIHCSESRNSALVCLWPPRRVRWKKSTRAKLPTFFSLYSSIFNILYLYYHRINTRNLRDKYAYECVLK